MLKKYNVIVWQNKKRNTREYKILSKEILENQTNEFSKLVWTMGGVSYWELGLNEIQRTIVPS